MDYGLIVVYALLVLAIGFGFSRQQGSSANYLLAGRSMGWAAVGISQLASLLSAISYLGTPGEAYGYDLQYLLFSICGFLCVPLAIYFFLDFFYRLQVTSIYEYLERRFNFPTRLLASAVFISRLSWMATIVVAVSLAIEELTGIQPAVSIILTTAVATAYTLVGGMKAIIWTDVLQFFLFTLGLAAAVALIFWKDPASELLAVMVRDDKLKMFDFSLDPTTRITVWMALTAGTVNGVANLTDQVSMQRYLSCGSLREARRAVWFKPFLSIPVTVLIYGLGLALYAHHQLNPELAVGIGSADRAFPHFVLNEMRGGLAGLILAAIFAAAMSSIDSGTHTISTVCVEDYYKRLIRPDAPDGQCLRLARGLTLVWAVVIAVLAQFLTGQDTIVGTMATVAAPFFGCAVGMFVLGTATRRATGWGTSLGALVGYGLVLVAKYWLFKIDGQWLLLPGGPDPYTAATVEQVSKFWLTFISFAGTVIPGYLISLASPAPSRARLQGLTLWDGKGKSRADDGPGSERKQD
jgi:sodium-coupled monocarboxylate transporter 8/12